jgi:hypothetical protein
MMHSEEATLALTGLVQARVCDEGDEEGKNC